MNNYIPSYPIWESSIPRTIELYNLSEMVWSIDETSIEKFKEERKIDKVEIYKTKDSSRGIKYVFKTWYDEGFYHILLEENSKILFVSKYFEEDKIHYDQDCRIVIGKKIKF
jgi:hypothetical protein